MASIPPEYQWSTQDGRTLDIRWMDTVHLVNTVNMLIRVPGNKLDQRKVEALLRTPQVKPGNVRFVVMVKELKSRMKLEWGKRVKEGLFYDQIGTGVTDKRESIKVMCMIRAILDTNVVPGILDYHEAIKWLRHEPDVIFQAVENEMHHKPHPDILRLWTKFTEYRLERT